MIVMFEYLPLVVFGIVYIVKDLLTATAALIIVSIVSIPIIWKKTGKVPSMHIITTFLLTVMGGMTVFSGDTDFIKMKPTIVSLVFASILLGGSFFKIYPLQSLFSKVIEMNQRSWRIISFRTAVYFFIMAIANEYVWRTQTEAIWVNFKIFGLSLGYFAFLLSQLWFLKRNGTLK